MASIIPYKPGQPAVQGSQRYRLDITTYGDWKGERAATMTIPAASAAGVQLAPWNNLAEGFVANNSESGDTEGSKLRIPNNLPSYVQGVALFAVADGDSYHPMLLYLGRYTGAAGIPWQLPAAGERLTVYYRADESGLDGEGDYLQLAIRTGPLANDVAVSVHLIVDAAGVSTAELNSIKAQQTTDETRIAALEARPAGAAVNLPPTGTQAQAEDGTGTTPYLWTGTGLRHASEAAVTAELIEERTGGFLRSASQSNNQLHIVMVRSDGAVEHVTFTPQAGGGGGITAQQARNEAGSLLSTRPEFTYDATTGTLTFTEPRPTDIAIGELAQAVQDLINSKLDGPAVDRRIAANADIRALTSFEASLKHEDEWGTGTVRVAASNAESRLGVEWWQFEPDDAIRVVAEYGPDDAAASSPSFPASQLRSVNTQGAQLNSTNSNQWRTADNSVLFSVTNENGHVGVSADGPGDYTFTVFLTRTRLRTPFIGDRQVTKAKLSQDVVNQLDEAHSQTGHTDDEIADIADREAAKYLRNVDLVASKTVRFTTQFQGRVAGEVGIADSALGFQDGDTAYRTGLLIRRSNETVDLAITPIDSRDALRGWQFQIGADRFGFSAAGYNQGDATNADLYSFPGPSTAFSTTEDTVIGLLPPPSTPLPKGKAGQRGYVARLNSSLNPEWDKPVGGFKLLSGPGVGVAVVSNTAPVHGNIQLFRPGGTGYFDLDLEDTDRFLLLAVTWTISGLRSESISFVSGTTAEHTHRFTALVHLDEVVSANAFSLSGFEGVRAYRNTMFLGTDNLGVHQFWIVKNANNELGYWQPYVPGPSVTAGQMDWNLAATVRAYV